ncbi:MAG: redoxin domain-containing protein [bacterium]
MALADGTKAPDFELPEGAPDNLVSLSDHRGKNVVLLFFPMAFTGVCTDEMCQVTSQLNEYSSLDAEVFGISVNSPFTQNEWKESENIDIPLLSDFNREAITAYDVKREELLGLEDVADRSAFVIDKDGVIRYSWVTEDPSQLPDFDEIKSVLRDLN